MRIKQKMINKFKEFIIFWPFQTRHVFPEISYSSTGFECGSFWVQLKHTMLRPSEGGDLGTIGCIPSMICKFVLQREIKIPGGWKRTKLIRVPNKVKHLFPSYSITPPTCTSRRSPCGFVSVHLQG